MGCAHKFETADLIIHNGVIYTLDDENTIVEALAIKDGKIIDRGPEREIMNKYSASEYLDAKGRAVYPGFFDAHCHLLGYGMTFIEANLKNLDSWHKVIDEVKLFSKSNDSKWIKGRGWDQNLWANKEFPTNELLNQAFPNQPIS